MDKIEKALRRLSAKERGVVKEILGRVQASDFRGLQVKKLRGHNDVFRIRKGDIRIIYRTRDDGGVSVLAIERRSEKTYKRF